MSTMLQIQDTAPLQIVVKNQDNEQVSLQDLIGKPVVIYFYPKDDTPGCTKEACSFRDYQSELKDLGVQVVGVSADTPVKHQKFIDKYDLNFPLWSDEDKELISAFGAIGEKKMFGKSYQGILRSTFALDENGTVIQVWPKVKPADHAQEIIKFFESRK